MKITRIMSEKTIETYVEFEPNCYCPSCGKKEVFTEIGEGDVYEGTQSYCKNCKNTFYLPNSGKDETLEFIDIEE